MDRLWSSTWPGRGCVCVALRPSGRAEKTRFQPRTGFRSRPSAKPGELGYLVQPSPPLALVDLGTVVIRDGLANGSEHPGLGSEPQRLVFAFDYLAGFRVLDLDSMAAAGEQRQHTYHDDFRDHSSSPPAPLQRKRPRLTRGRATGFPRGTGNRTGKSHRSLLVKEQGRRAVRPVTVLYIGGAASLSLAARAEIAQLPKLCRNRVGVLN
jgi:hypothetical protein